MPATVAGTSKWARPDNFNGSPARGSGIDRMRSVRWDGRGGDGVPALGDRDLSQQSLNRRNRACEPGHLTRKPRAGCFTERPIELIVGSVDSIRRARDVQDWLNGQSSAAEVNPIDAQQAIDQRGASQWSHGVAIGEAGALPRLRQVVIATLVTGV